MCWRDITFVNLFSSEEEDEDDVGNEFAYDDVGKCSVEEVTAAILASKSLCVEEDVGALPDCYRRGA